jgi:hypothetical protein
MQRPSQDSTRSFQAVMLSNPLHLSTLGQIRSLIGVLRKVILIYFHRSCLNGSEGIQHDVELPLSAGQSWSKAREFADVQ